MHISSQGACMMYKGCALYAPECFVQSLWLDHLSSLPHATLVEGKLFRGGLVGNAGAIAKRSARPPAISVAWRKLMSERTPTTPQYSCDDDHQVTHAHGTHAIERFMFKAGCV